MTDTEIAAFVRARKQGNANAVNLILPLVYTQLHGLAQQYMRNERRGHTLRTTALVHEAYLKLVSAEISFEDRAHFLAVAATTMRNILVNHANASQSAKRGGGRQRVDWDDVETEVSKGLPIKSDPAEILDLNAALDRLTKQDERMGRLMEMYYFGGLTCEEAATVLAVSIPTVKRDMKLAKAWLKCALAPGRTQSAA